MILDEAAPEPEPEEDSVETPPVTEQNKWLGFFKRFYG